MQQYSQHKASAAQAQAEGDYDALKQQAAFYAQQQQSIQTQLESCLATTTQQFMNEFAVSQSQQQQQQQQQQHQLPPYSMPYQYSLAK